MRILNFGSLNIDYVYDVEQIVSPGETVSSSSFSTFEGGKGLNQSIALARAGATVFHAGCIGEDGTKLLELCKKEKVDVSQVRVLPHSTGHAIIQVSRTGQNSIIVYPGANKMITPEMVDAAIRDFSSGDFLLIQNEVNLLEYIIDAAFERGMKVVLNPSPFDGCIEKCNLQKVSLFIVNEIEAQQLAKTERIESIIETMRGLYPQAQTVITLGVNGAVYFDSRDTYKASGKKVAAVDTTAAGDTFTGYFIAFIAKGDKPETALEIANAAAALSVTKKGAAPSIPYGAEVDINIGG